MINARDELARAVGARKIICAIITLGFEDPQPKTISLSVGHTKEELRQFLDCLSFVYDDGYGAQYLEGTVWFGNGTWLERKEYDGSEWWVVKSYPEIPQYLNEKGYKV